MSFKPRFQPSYLSWINSDRPRRATAVLLSSSCVWGEHTVKRITLQQFVTFDSWISFLSIEPRNSILMQSYQYILSSSAEHQVPSRSHSRTSWGLVHLMRLHFLILGAKFLNTSLTWAIAIYVMWEDDDSVASTSNAGELVRKFRQPLYLPVRLLVIP